jgi:nitrite reductase (NADH) small subunit
MQMASARERADDTTPIPVDLTAAAGTWVRICRLDDIVPNTGVGALLGARQIAVVRVQGQGGGSEIYAVSNFDPFSKAFVLARGIVGDKQGVPKIASPIYKQSFDLRTGVCLDDGAVKIPTFPVRVQDGVVEVFQAREDTEEDA